MTTLRKLLVPVDFSEPSQRALEDAIGLARIWQAELHLLHCYQIHPAVIDPYGLAYPDSFERDIRAAAGNRLAAWKAKAEAEGLKATSHLSARFPSDEIPELAERLGIDLIVMGTRGLSGLKHALLGSVTERTLRAAPCPVWVARAGE